MKIKKYTVAAAMLAILMLAFSGSALASNYFPDNINTLQTYLNGNGVSYTAYSGSVSGMNYVTSLGFEAGDTNTLNISSGAVLFTNKSVATDFAAATVKYADLTNAFFQDTSRSSNNIFSLNGGNNVKIYELGSAWTLSNGLTLGVGTLILGLNDNFGCSGNDKDFDDMIVAVSSTTPTPIPAAVWLLGSGMLGLMGFKKTRQKV